MKLPNASHILHTTKRHLYEQAYKERMLQDIRAYRLDKLDELLIKLNIDEIKDPAEVRATLAKVPQLRHNREASIKMIEKKVAERRTNEEWANKWEKIANYVLTPVAYASLVYLYVSEREENEHFDSTFADYKPYPYLHVRRTKMPFRDGQSLFFNPKRNYDPKIHGPR